MKIERSRQMGTPTRVAATRADAGSAAAGATAGVHQVEDTTSLMGIPETELTPKVRQALMELFEEVAKLREELKRSKLRLGDLERLANEDSLVPISNRRAWVRELSRIIAYAQRYQIPSSVIYVDLNDMKAINDKYGHAAGDAALKHVAQALVDNVRESDVVGRLGGDEFGVILVQADAQKAAIKAAGLVAVISKTPLVWESQQIPITVAYGAHTFTGDEDAAATLNAADEAMYANKQGRPGAGES
jgi:diguanylate cyclase (GGDEF)-like protein